MLKSDNHFVTHEGRKFIMDYLPGNCGSDSESDQFVKVIRVLVEVLMVWEGV